MRGFLKMANMNDECFVHIRCWRDVLQASKKTCIASSDQRFIKHLVASSGHNFLLVSGFFYTVCTDFTTSSIFARVVAFLRHIELQNLVNSSTWKVVRWAILLKYIGIRLPQTWKRLE